MSYIDNMVEKFHAGGFFIGYFKDGHIASSRPDESAEEYCPFAIAIDCIQDPTSFSRVFRKAASGDKSTVGYYEGVNVGVLEITESGVRAELEFPDDEYYDEMAYSEFMVALDAWEKAWAAAQAYRATLPKA